MSAECSSDRGGIGRRAVVTGLAATSLVSAIADQARAQGVNTPPGLIQAMLGDGQRFGPSSLADLARALAKKPFSPPANDLAAPFNDLNFDRYVAIKSLPGTRLWEGDTRGFMAEPLARGFVFTSAVQLFTVDDGEVHRIAFDRARFNFGGLNVPANVDPGFSGVRLFANAGGPAPFEFAIIQGATFFRAMARGQNFGITARALALKAGDPRGEEFPFFRALWLERPAPGTNALVVHGLIDSDSATATVRMTMRPGEATIVDVETTLFPRVTLDHVGLGTMAGAFLFGPNVRQTTDDMRPGAYETGGLSILNGNGEWLWRPLNNPDTLQIAAFLDNNPKGFGLLQRERAYSAFWDDVQHYEGRPSVWIEPLGEWSQGAVQLVEIPSDAEINKNILAYWRPKAPMSAGSEVSLSYRQFWAWQAPERPGLATVAATRSGRGSQAKRRRFLVEFRGGALATPPADMKPTLSVAPGAIQNPKLWSNPADKTVRVTFELDPGNETACEMRLLLQSGDKPLSETWLYRWTP